MSQRPQTRSNQERFRRYGPVSMIGAASLIAIFGLPSVLNLPQANPGQVAEYAPVPPDDQTQAPPGGNFAGLGLGSGSTLATGDSPFPNVGAGNAGSGIRSQFRCVIVNGVPRQSEDPLSPPCVPTFQGDNGGATYQGVSRKEIKIVYYIGCSETNNTFSPTSRGQENATCGSKDDLDAPPSDDDFLHTRALKRFMVYFNTRYQTYGRHVHGYVYYGHFTVAATGPGGCREDCRRSDAIDTYKSYKPFATITGGQSAFMDSYTQAMAQKRVLNFGTASGHSLKFFQQYPGLIWSYSPSIEQQADIYSSFLCREAVGRQAKSSGHAEDRTKTRKFGIIYTSEEGDTYYTPVKRRVEKALAACGVPKPPQYSYDTQGAVEGDPRTRPTKAAQLADLRQQGVTTILLVGVPDGGWAAQSKQLNWFPEWILFGEGTAEDFVNGRYVDQDVWSHAWIVSQVTKVGRQDDQLCALAIREVDPSFPSVDIPWACGFYDNLRQLFTGIQVAGPKLTPANIDEGFHAIPAVPSTSPQVPACFYRPGDYTCVKDSISMWWDPNGQIRGWSGQGCWRLTDDGKRYLVDGWPRRNFSDSKRVGRDVCNGYTSNTAFNPYSQTG